MSENKFRYEIHPRIPMRNVLDKAIIKPTTVELTLEQVKECLKYGPVYRRFNADHIEKVTLATIENLHKAKFEPDAPAKKVEVSASAEEPVKKVIIKSKEDIKAVSVITKEKVEEPAPIEEAPAEEAKEEIPVVEEKVEEVVDEAPAAIEEKIEEVKEETVPEAPVDDAVEEEKTVESSEEQNVTEVTEDDGDDVEAPKSGNVGKKRKHH